MAKYKYESYDYSIIGINKVLKASLGDISAFNNIDAERELTAILSEQIAAEVDRAILASMRVAFAPSHAPTYINNREDFLRVYNNETSS